MYSGHITPANQPATGIKKLGCVVNEGNGAEPEHQQCKVEVADKQGGVISGQFGLPHIRHRKQSHQNVRQPDGAEEHRHLNSQYLDRIVKYDPRGQNSLSFGVIESRLLQQP